VQLIAASQQQQQRQQQQQQPKEEDESLAFVSVRCKLLLRRSSSLSTAALSSSWKTFGQPAVHLYLEKVSVRYSYSYSRRETHATHNTPNHLHLQLFSSQQLFHQQVVKHRP